MAYGLTQSTLLVLASNQEFTAADSASLSLTNNTTYEGWFKFTTLPSAGQQWGLIARYGSGASTNNGLLFYIQNTGGTITLNTNATQSSTEREVKYTWAPSTDTWYHLATTFASGVVTTYVNGTSIGSSTMSDNTSFNDSSIPYELGGYASNNAGRAFNGRISLVRIWGVVRTQGQLAADLCNVLGSTANLSAEWTLDNTLADNSGNSNTLTNVNSATFGADVPSVCATTNYDETYTETMTLTDTVNKATTRLLTEVTALGDTFSGVFVYAQELLESLVLTDTITRAITRVRTEVLTLVDTIPRTTARLFTETTTLTDLIATAQTIGRVFTETLSLVDKFLVNGTDVIWAHIAKAADAVWTKITRS